MTGRSVLLLFFVLFFIFIVFAPPRTASVPPRAFRRLSSAGARLCCGSAPHAGKRRGYRRVNLLGRPVPASGLIPGCVGSVKPPSRHARPSLPACRQLLPWSAATCRAAPP